MPEKCKQPGWARITEHASKKIEKKFKQYKNSWVEYYDPDFWNQRLQGEVDEVKELSDLEYEEKMDELIDVINICAMQYTNLMLARQHEVVATRLGL